MSVVLSPIWHHLPQEIVETILTHHVDSFIDRDPALAWVQLRQISGYQLRRIERHFRQHWLPKMSITLYSPDAGCWSIEYFFHAFDEDNKKIVIFAAEELALNSWPVFTQGFEPAATILDVWADFARSPINKRNITVRLGEGVLSGGYHGGYIVNDTDLPGLQHPPRAEQGRYVQFDWMRAMNELLREEMFMRNVADKMVRCLITHLSIPSA
ncbi:hypothetical protein B0H66DRAFT_217428 [Apodospora peruviana]|uniref:Uncharacterized protein n=1 Tax=Apodospora peruviana TaxID=516989 RepID=A0AAE0IDG9_9PEZI|nr:hypothetical protein B0H66DRAFT_217428 [Apodospora peruviana]